MQGGSDGDRERGKENREQNREGGVRQSGTEGWGKRKETNELTKINEKNSQH